MAVNVRFAPSPTGMLHIGGARTALINRLFALSKGGSYYLRIEDTDKTRSTDAARDAILEGLAWLGLSPDAPALFQSDYVQNHREAAEALIAKGAAYYCYETPEQLQGKRAAAEKKGEKYFYDRIWREKSQQDAPQDIAPAIRIKAPLCGESVIDDRVQGAVRVAHNQLDDFVILRSDGTPTYLLSCVVDDVMMKISHIIRGDDHLTNAFRQKQVFEMLGAAVPQFAHLPLLHGADGKKFSKRHGTVSIAGYQKMGYLPEALVNYLLQLGWGWAEEKISLNDAAKIFALSKISKAAARFDFAKLNHLNSLYLRAMPEEQLLRLMREFLPEADRDNLPQSAFAKGLAGLCMRADTLKQIAEQGDFYMHAPRLPLKDEKAAKALNVKNTKPVLEKLRDAFAARGEDSWQAESLHQTIADTAQMLDLSFGKCAQTLRACLTGSMASPDLSEVVLALGQKETLRRIDASLTSASA